MGKHHRLIFWYLPILNILIFYSQLVAYNYISKYVALKQLYYRVISDIID